MTRQDKIDRINKEIANKELSLGCRVEGDFTWNGVETLMIYQDIAISGFDERWLVCKENGNTDDYHIIGHPVLIGDIYKYIDQNCNWIETPDGKSRDMVKHKEMICTIYYLFLGKYNKPIEKQLDECIDFIDNLILGQN